MNTTRPRGAAVLAMVLALTSAASAAPATYAGVSRGARMSITLEGKSGWIGEIRDGSGSTLYMLRGQTSGQTLSIQGQPKAKGAKAFSAIGTPLGSLGVLKSQLKVTNVPLPTGPVDFTLDCIEGTQPGKGQSAPTLKLTASKSMGTRQYSAQATLTANGHGYDLDGSLVLKQSGVIGQTDFHLGGLVRDDGSQRTVTVSLLHTNSAQPAAGFHQQGTASFDGATNQFTLRLSGLSSFGFQDATLTFQ